MGEIIETPDLFLDRQDKLSYRDLMNLMEYPFFSISKNPVHETRTYDDGKGVVIEIKPGHRGIATIWDKDILIYIASQLNRMMNEDMPVSPRIRFHAHDFFVSCGRSPGGRAYEGLIETLDRLQSTSIRTTIATKNGDAERSFFSWIKSGRMTERVLPGGKRVLGMVEVELEDWVWRQIREDRSVLAIDEAYFQLTSGIARRMYEMCRKSCGHQPLYQISLTKMREKAGYGASVEEISNFRRMLLRVIASDELPEYRIHLALIGDATNAAIENPSKIRGIKGHKAVITRRDQHDRRALPAPEAELHDRRAEEPELHVRRVEPEPEASDEDKALIQGRMKALLASMQEKIR